MKLYYPLTIDMYKIFPLVVLTAQQGNVGRGAIISLTAGGAIVDPTGEEVEIYAKKEDGTVSWMECEVENSKVKVDFTNEMLACPGMMQVELRFKNDPEDVTTPIFIVDVKKSNVQSAGRSKNELPVLDQIIATANMAVQNSKKTAEVVGGYDHTMIKVLTDYAKGKAWETFDISVGDDITDIKAIRDDVYAINGTGCFACVTKLCEGDHVEFTKTWFIGVRQNYSDKVVITNKDKIVVKTVAFNEIENNVSIDVETDGYMYLSSEYYDSTKTLFFITRKNSFSPLILEESEATEYLNDSVAGEEALNAILSGRQILVRVPNADGGNYTANYSPVYMYQLPNYDNNYLYLFYLKDEKETIDLSATGAGKVEMPIYGQLKMLLSKTYNADPLT